MNRESCANIVTWFRGHIGILLLIKGTCVLHSIYRLAASTKSFIRVRKTEDTRETLGN